MLFSVDWLKQYVEVPSDPEALGQRLTMAGLAVEGIERQEIPDSVLVGKILEAKQHPNADRLTLCTVDVGAEEPLQIVCGAPNARTGLIGAVATVGTVLPNGLKIKKGKIRGEVSMGMLCAEDELGIGQDHDGIIELESGTPGEPAKTVLGTGDVVLDIDITANRGDCTSHVGIAREISALGGSPMEHPEINLVTGGADTSSQIKVEIENLEDCPRYMARIIRGVKVGPSPDWLVERLEAVGQRSINNIVDVTNFVLLETGQPLHAFDLAKIQTGRILVRRAKEGEELLTLDEEKRKVDPEILMITDGEQPIALAGVMGGFDSEVTEATTEILLEGAVFQAARIFRGSRKLRLETEAALRFRRGVDPKGTAWAMDRAAELMATLGGGTVAEGVVDVKDEAVLAEQTIPFRPISVERLMGETYPLDEIRSSLKSFGFGLQETTSEEWAVTVPSWRRDVHEECDLVEEVARHRGYDAMGTRDYNYSAVAAPRQPAEVLRRRVSEILRGFGYSEAITRVLSTKGHLNGLGISEEKIGDRLFSVLEPPSLEEETLRASLVPGLADVVSHNLRHGSPEVRVFEIGKTFQSRGVGKLAKEDLWLGLAASGGDFEPSKERAGRSYGLDEFKGVCESLLRALQIDDLKWQAYTGEELFPHGALAISSGRQVLGFVWELSPRARKGLGVRQPMFAGQIKLDSLPHSFLLPRTYQEPSRYPSVKRDLALVVPKSMTQQDVRDLIRKAAGEQLESLELFDHYEGKHIPDGHQGLGFSLVFRAGDRTLEESEIDRWVGKIIKQLEGREVKLRDA